MIQGVQAYLQTRAQTTTQGELLILLYEGAIKFLKQAKIKIEEKDYAQKGILISKAMDVITELNSSLDKQAGELSNNLGHLYFYSNAKLLRANLEMNTDYIDEVIHILDRLCDGFRTITNKQETVTSQSQKAVVPNPKAKTYQAEQLAANTIEKLKDTVDSKRQTPNQQQEKKDFVMPTTYGRPMRMPKTNVNS